MNIGQAAEITGVSSKMIRHYEEIGLIPKSHRTGAGYRVYRESDLHVLSFIKTSRTLGFSLDKIRLLLSLWQDKSRASADVKRLALDHIALLSEKIDELVAMREQLQTLAHHCQGDQRPDCPIIKGLEVDSRAAVGKG